MSKLPHLFTLITAAFLLSACSQNVPQEQPSPVPMNDNSEIPLNTTEGAPVADQQTETTSQAKTWDPTTITSLQIEEIEVGTGATVETGSSVVVNYTGYLPDGTIFDSSIPRRQPFSFTVGQGRVIEGWERGLIGMKLGGQRRLLIPASMGYGEGGVPGTIPPNSPLIFEIELLNIQE